LFYKKFVKYLNKAGNITRIIESLLLGLFLPVQNIISVLALGSSLETCRWQNIKSYIVYGGGD
jgi:hypothetical protein